MKWKGQRYCKMLELQNADIVTETQVVVLMGGLGTRLGLKDRPKAMADVNGIPFFDYQMRLLKRWGFHKFLFLVGCQAECIEEHYGDGSAWQVAIRYSHDGARQMGTGGALKNAEGELEQDFLLIYGDSFMDIDYRETVYRYQMEKAAGKLGVMTILQNKNCYDKSNVVYRDGELVLYDKVNTRDEMQSIDYGVSMLSKDILATKKAGEEFDIAAILKELSTAGRLAAQVVTKRFYEIGNPDSLEEFRVYAKGRFGRKHKAVFFDRDGVINELCFNDDTEQLDSPFRREDFQYKQGAVDAMLAFQKRGYSIFIVTNQPAAAKGKVSLSVLYDLNTWMVQDLESRGIMLESVNMCPHHPEGSPKSEARFLIRRCDCRKPEPGLITDLLQAYNIDVSRSYMVGDSYTDMIAGKKAGLRTVLVGELKCDMCHRLREYRPDYVIRDIGELEKTVGGQGEYV